MGPPSQILTDQGQNFMSNVLKVVTNKFTTTRIRTSLYHRLKDHSTRKSVLRKCCLNKRDWPELALYYLRNKAHRISSYSI